MQAYTVRAPQALDPAQTDQLEVSVLHVPVEVGLQREALAALRAEEEFLRLVRVLVRDAGAVPGEAALADAALEGEGRRVLGQDVLLQRTDEAELLRAVQALQLH